MSKMLMPQLLPQCELVLTRFFSTGDGVAFKLLELSFLILEGLRFRLLLPLSTGAVLLRWTGGGIRHSAEGYGEMRVRTSTFMKSSFALRGEMWKLLCIYVNWSS